MNPNPPFGCGRLNSRYCVAAEKNNPQSGRLLMGNDSMAGLGSQTRLHSISDVYFLLSVIK